MSGQLVREIRLPVPDIAPGMCPCLYTSTLSSTSTRTTFGSMLCRSTTRWKRAHGYRRNHHTPPPICG